MPSQTLHNRQRHVRINQAAHELCTQAVEVVNFTSFLVGDASSSQVGLQHLARLGIRDRKQRYARTPPLVNPQLESLDRTVRQRLRCRLLAVLRDLRTDDWANAPNAKIIGNSIYYSADWIGAAVIRGARNRATR